MKSETTDENGRMASKVARVLTEYDLGESYGAQLEAMWTADGDDRRSLRDLAGLLNKRLLEHEMTNNGMTVLEGEVENIYRLLTADDVSSGNRTEARSRLKQQGVDIDQLETDFVTYQAVRTYLKEYRGADYSAGASRARAEDSINTIQRLKSRVRSVADQHLQQLQKTNQLTLGESRLFVQVDVLCEDCNTQRGLVELLRGGGCDCPTDPK